MQLTAWQRRAWAPLPYQPKTAAASAPTPAPRIPRREVPLPLTGAAWGVRRAACTAAGCMAPRPRTHRSRPGLAALVVLGREAVLPVRQDRTAVRRWGRAGCCPRASGATRGVDWSSTATRSPRPLSCSGWWVSGWRQRVMASAVCAAAGVPEGAGMGMGWDTGQHKWGGPRPMMPLDHQAKAGHRGVAMVTSAPSSRGPWPLMQRTLHQPNTCRQPWRTAHCCLATSNRTSVSPAAITAPGFPRP